MSELDPRLLRISIQTQSGFKTFEDLFITAVGSKYSNSIFNGCDVTITNMDKATQDLILTETSPYLSPNYSQKTILIEAGRQSYGYSRVFLGNIVASYPSQPPDITITLRCVSNYYGTGTIIAINQPQSAPMSVIARQLANDSGLILDFQATDKNISNFNYTGGISNQLKSLEKFGLIDAFIDDSSQKLIVKDRNKPLIGKIKILNLDTGMIGIPQIDEFGIYVKYLFDNDSVLGGAVQISSVIYPAANGTFTIFKLDFELSNRDTPFYYIASCIRPPSTM